MSQFMRELREDTFSRKKYDDAQQHVERLLDIISLFNISGLTHEAVMLRIIPITLTEVAKRLVDRLSSGTVNSWDLLEKPLSKGLGKGPIPSMTPAQALTVIQTMADHSQKWHDGSSSRNEGSSSNSEGITTIVSKIDSLGRDIKNLKENVHVIQVGCQTCGGAYLDKECPLKLEVKSMEEVKYREFGRSFPYNSRND
nr:hypothetical protein [Tanacetum cinerariifolium]